MIGRIFKTRRNSLGKAQSALAPGTPAPDFTLPSGPGGTISLSDFRGQPVVLVFYPADWSPVCGDQVVLYNEILPIFEEYKAQLLGISVDGVWSHQAFAEATTSTSPYWPTSSRRVLWRGPTASTARKGAPANEHCS